MSDANTTPLAKGVVFASDMQWTKATAGADTTVHRDTNLKGQPLAINGKSYPKGLWTHAFNDQTPADIVFDISGRKYATFKATVGLDNLAGLYKLRQLKRNRRPVNRGWDEGPVCMS
jgi:hypothetical protein